MSIAVYIRKEYFRAVTIKDKSAHILEFHYMPRTIDVFEEGYPVFHLEYILESKVKANILEFYLTDFALRGRGYGTVCMNEIADQFGRKGITLITAPTGYDLAPLGYTGPDQYHELMAGFYEKTGFSISGDGDLAMKILEDAQI
ncbi:MAG TPA: GNAT family N-acetyltransferase [Candidatus Mediterraneibacter colneyensis]|nr:GNAT family N-acetyltransferase [Candidatus Mediterraneibacter colneyensis]